MADPSSTTNPTAAGATTSEGKGSKVVVILASVIAALGTLTQVIDSLTSIIPASQKGLGLWLAIGGAAIAGLTQIAYTVQRGWVKVAAIQAGNTPPADPSAPGVVTPTPAQAAANLGK